MTTTIAICSLGLTEYGSLREIKTSLNTVMSRGSATQKPKIVHLRGVNVLNIELKVYHLY